MRRSPAGHMHILPAAAAESSTKTAAQAATKTAADAAAQVTAEAAAKGRCPGPDAGAHPAAQAAADASGVEPAGAQVKRIAARRHQRHVATDEAGGRADVRRGSYPSAGEVIWWQQACLLAARKQSGLTVRR